MKRALRSDVVDVRRVCTVVEGEDALRASRHHRSNRQYRHEPRWSARPGSESARDPGACSELDTGRARHVPGWEPRSSSEVALRAFPDGLRANEGGPSRPLAPDAVQGRIDELRTGVAERNTAQRRFGRACL